LGEITRATRQAYVKFIIPKIKKDESAPPTAVDKTTPAAVPATPTPAPTTKSTPATAKPAPDAAPAKVPETKPTPAPEKPSEPAKTVAPHPPATTKTDEKLVKSPVDPPKPDATAKPKEAPPKKEETLKPPQVERVEVQGSPSRGKSKVSGKVVSGWL
jgi:hypothetical protein